MLRLTICCLALLAALLQAGATFAEDAGQPADMVASEDVAGDDSEKIVDRIPQEVDDETLAAALNAAFPAASEPAPSFQRAPASATWSKIKNRDGSAKYSVNKPIAAPWDMKIGADISVAPAAADSIAPRPLPATAPDNGSASAWANVAVPHLATVELRAEPAVTYDKVATRIERSVPLGRNVAVTVQGGVGVTDMRGPAPTSETAVARLVDFDKSLQISFLPTGTTLAAGSSTVTGDPVAHQRLSVAQKIYGPLTVTGAITDVGQASASTSVTAGMNFAW